MTWPTHRLRAAVSPSLYNSHCPELHVRTDLEMTDTLLLFVRGNTQSREQMTAFTNVAHDCQHI